MTLEGNRIVVRGNVPVITQVFLLVKGLWTVLAKDAAGPAAARSVDEILRRGS